jgi:hypothetical protein
MREMAPSDFDFLLVLDSSPIQWPMKVQTMSFTISVLLSSNRAFQSSYKFLPDVPRTSPLERCGSHIRELLQHFFAYSCW